MLVEAYSDDVTEHCAARIPLGLVWALLYTGFWIARGFRGVLEAKPLVTKYLAGASMEGALVSKTKCAPSCHVVIRNVWSTKRTGPCSVLIATTLFSCCSLELNASAA